MKAIVYTRYGSADVLRLEEVPTPVPADDEILIKILAVSINGSDREALMGSPLYARMGGLRKPGSPILGSDIAGRVEVVGRNHSDFKLGDEVFGELPNYHGGFAEYACTSGKTLALKPPGLSFEEAAAIPQAGCIALRAIRDKGQVQPGQKVLINGAGGGAGMFAIQLARLQGAEVTGVDNASKLDYLRALGAEHVIDYKRENFTRNGKQYDLILDVIAHRSAFECARALKPNGTYFFVGGSVGVIFQILFFGPWIRRMSGRNVRMLIAPQNRKDLLSVTELCLAGKIVPMIDRRFPLSETAAAMRYVSDGHTKGKVVITMNETNKA